MKNKNRRRISCLLSAVLLLVMSFGFGTFAGAEESDSSKPVVWIVGDSTVSAFTDNYYFLDMDGEHRLISIWMELLR